MSLGRAAIATTMAAALGATFACGGKGPAGPSSGGGGGGGGTTRPQLIVNYGGFVGQSFTASDPTPCPTAACSIAAPAQTVRTPTAYSYSVSAGMYRIDGTLNGRPAPLTPPATNVSAALAVSFGWQIVSSFPLLGIERATFRVNGNLVSPNDPGSTGPGCGRYMESFTPSQVIPWSFTFTILEYTFVRPDICV